jgi:hypothetical protein
VAAEGKRYAVLIGVNDYIDSGIVDLNAPRNDVHDLAKALAGWDKVFTMTDELDLRGPDSPVRGNIENRLALLSELTTDGDTILVFFSGHGYSNPAGDARILPLDASVNRLADTTMSLAAINTLLMAKGKRNVLFMIDACKETVTTSKGLSVIGVSGDAAAKTGALNAFYATQSGWYSYEDTGGAHGVFSRFLLEGLSGAADSDHDRTVTAGELAKWLPDAATQYALAKGIRQKPFVSLSDAGIGDVKLSAGNAMPPKPSATVTSDTINLNVAWQGKSNLTPVLIYNFDNTVSNEADDGFETKVTDIALSKGRDGSSIGAFNGKTSRIHLTTTDPEYLYQSSFVVRFKSTSDKYRQAFLQNDGLAKNGLYFALNGETLEFTLDGTDIKDMPNFAFKNGIWYTVAVVCDLVNKTVDIYADGKKIYTRKNARGQPIKLERFNIGAWDSEDRYFAGMIDYFYVYNGILDEAALAGLGNK